MTTNTLPLTQTDLDCAACRCGAEYVEKPRPITPRCAAHLLYVLELANEDIDLSPEHHHAVCLALADLALNHDAAASYGTLWVAHELSPRYPSDAVAACEVFGAMRNPDF